MTVFHDRLHSARQRCRRVIICRLCRRIIKLRHGIACFDCLSVFDLAWIKIQTLHITTEVLKHNRHRHGIVTVKFLVCSVFGIVEHSDSSQVIIAWRNVCIAGEFYIEWLFRLKIPALCIFLYFAHKNNPCRRFNRKRL